MARDRKDLKIQALLEKISGITTNYENQIADLRVNLTVMQEEHAEQIQVAKDEIARLHDQVAALENEANPAEAARPVVIPGEVERVSEED